MVPVEHSIEIKELNNRTDFGKSCTHPPRLNIIIISLLTTVFSQVQAHMYLHVVVSIFPRST